MSPEPVGPEVVVVGSVNADIVARVAAHPTPGETVLGRSMTVLPGGKGANQAVAAARLGSRVAFIGAVGEDAFAAPAQAGLRAAGVDLEGLAVTTGATGIALITVSAGGENTIVVVPGVNATVDAERVRAHHDLVARAPVVVVQGEIPRDGIEEVARTASGRLVVNLAPVVDVAPEVLFRADPLVLNEYEAVLVAEALGASAPQGGPASEASTAEIAAWLLGRGVPSIVLTVGARGAYLGESGGAIVHVPSPQVSTVDTTGAGDAFVGAIAHSLAEGRGLLAAVRLAVRVGAFSVQSAGAQPSFPGTKDTLPDGDA